MTETPKGTAFVRGPKGKQQERAGLLTGALRLGVGRRERE
jgi:hypothetical protein